MPVYKYNNNIIKVLGGVGGNPYCCCEQPPPPPPPCDCGTITSRHCSSVLWTIQNFFLLDNTVAPPVSYAYSFPNTTIIFPTLGITPPGVGKNLGQPPGSGAEISVMMVPRNICTTGPDGEIMIKLLLELRFTGTKGGLYCKDPLDPNVDQQFNFPWAVDNSLVYWEVDIGPYFCDDPSDPGFVDLTDTQVQMQIFGNPCPNGDTVFNAQWNITATDPFPELICPLQVI
jgi:hypothetical protein